ncbi:MAG: DUF255 domain-containing protein [Chitinophagaceae bacterium]
MKYNLIYQYLIIFMLTCSALFLNAQNKKTNSAGIQWLTLSEVEAKMKTEPRKVYVDIYTDWCYWCKVMEKKTFANKQVIDYLNKNFYCVRINAESADSIYFQGKKYGRVPNSKVNDLAAQWMNDQLSYPTSIFFEENFANRQPVPGYLELANMEMILTYLGENKQKTIPWDQYSKTFKARWK